MPKSTVQHRSLVLDRPVWISVEDACFAAGFGRTRLYELIADNTLESVKVGRKRLISFATLERLGQRAKAAAKQ